VLSVLSVVKREGAFFTTKVTKITKEFIYETFLIVLLRALRVLRGEKIL